MSLKDIYNYAAEAWDYRSGQSYNLDSWSEFKNEKAFERGVESASEQPVIYIDPDLLPVKEFQEAMSDLDADHNAVDIAIEGGELLKEQLDSQQPGAMDAVMDRYAEGAVGGVSPWRLFASISGGSPAAVSGIMIGDQEYCLIYKPSDEWDAKEDLIKNFIDNEEIARSVLENTSVDGSALNHAVGRHEGIHCNKPSDSESALDVLSEEVRADKLGFSGGGVEPDTALFMRDLRHLSATGYDAVHATGALLVNGTEPTEAHMIAATSYKNMMDAIAVFGSNNETLSVEDSEKLLQNDPEAYFSAVRDEIEIYKEETAEFYDSSPRDFMAQEIVTIAEAEIDYMNNYEAAYRRQVLQQDVPEPEPTQILSPEEKQSYLDGREDFYSEPEMPEPEFTPRPSDSSETEPVYEFDPYETPSPDSTQPDGSQMLPTMSFSGDDAAFSGDAGLLQEASAAGLNVRPDLMPEPLLSEETRSEPSSPQQPSTLSM